MTTKKTHISVAVDFDGLHHWADAQNFLEHPHQHRFSVRLRVATIAGDNSRSLEFFEVKSSLREAISSAFPDTDSLGVRNLGGLSTEAISDRLHDHLDPILCDRHLWIEVKEDNTQGSETEYPPGQSTVNDDVLFDTQEIGSRVDQLAKAITADYRHREGLTIVCLLKGGFVFAADLVRKIEHADLEVEFAQFKSYEGEQRGELQLVSPFPSLVGKNVLLVDDISDSGATLQAAIDLSWTAGAETVEAAVLLQRSVPEHLALAKYFGFLLLNEEFLYGYGLDLNEKQRNLPFIRSKAS